MSDWPVSPIRTIVLGSDVTTVSASPTFEDVTGLGLAISAGVTYALYALLYWQSAATTTGAAFALNGPASPTLMGYHVQWTSTSSTAMAYAFQRSYDSVSATTGVGSANAGYLAMIEGIIKPSADGTLIPRFATEIAASGVTVKAGSFFKVERIA